MSEPPNTLGTTTVETHHQDHKRQLQYLPVIHGGTTSFSTSQPREYRKGNWTIQETLVLITAKKLDEERRIKASSTPSSSSSCGGRTGELRWKWVENYCWNNGCLRSQNQCNDKWDNLLRDYKKVREYELRSSQSDGDGDDQVPPYWAMDRQERKDRNLPSNMAAEVYEALKDVVQKRYPQRTSTPTQPTHCTATPLTVHPPPPPPPPPAVAPPPVSETSDSSETDWSGKSNLDTKRRRVRDIGSSIIRSASVLARTLKSCEEKKEKRHRQMMELEERRLQVKETRNEMNRQGLAGLVAAVNNLSGAMHSLISDRPEHT